MKRFSILLCAVVIAATAMQGCGPQKKDSKINQAKHDSIMQSKVNEYATVKLTTDKSFLNKNEKELLAVLIDVAKIMDDIFWQQTLGDKNLFLDSIKNEPEQKFALINYGPWDRLDDNKAFIEKYGPRPLGANFYPKDMTKAEFEKLGNPDKGSLYTVIRRNADKSLKVVWYHDEYKQQLTKAAELLRKAAALAEDKGFKTYLELRADALLSSNYQPSDMAWMDMKNNHIDFVVGPIEHYEDALFGYKAAFEAFVLVKDMDWSKTLDKFIARLPQLQKQLPVDEKFKKEVPGTSSQLAVYDVVYYAGDCNAGGKTIAINLPNDEQVQAQKGSRRLQLKNTMKAKFDDILLPISQKLTDYSQLKNVKFDAFFNNIMFHEVAHGLGIKNTINGKGTVSKAMKEIYSAFEEGKADILGLFLVSKLIENGDIDYITKQDCYVTFMASIFRSVRFGAADAHGKANMMCFNFFEKAGAFTRSEKGTYLVNMDKMKDAIDKWAATIITFQGNGDYDGAAKYLKENAVINPQLQKDLDGLKSANIPKDIIFEQGKETLGL